MRKILIAVCILVIIFVVIFITQRSKATVEPGNTDEDQVMVIDFCKSTAATVGGDGYTETVLYQNRDGSLEVHYFSKYEGDEKESHTFYPAEDSVLEEAYKIINKYHMDKWNEKYDGPGLEGGGYSLGFRTDKGGFIRVSSDRMPDNGVRMMNEVCECLNNSVVK